MARITGTSDRFFSLVNPLQYQGNILVNSDFPTSAEVQNGWFYIIKADVTDDDATKTNTGQVFLNGDEIVWNGTDWSVLGNLTGYFTLDQTTPQTIENGRPIFKEGLDINTIPLAEDAWVSPNYNDVTGMWMLNDDLLNVKDTGNGTGTGTISYVDGLHGQKALSLIGDGYVTIDNESNFDAQNALTVGAWVYVTELTGGNAGVVSKYWSYTGQTNKRSYAIDVNSSGNPIFYYSTNGSSALSLTTTKQLTLNTWYHLSATWDGTRVSIYINAERVASTISGVPTTLFNSDQPVRIGVDFDINGDTQKFKGMIQDAFVCTNKSMNEDELSEIMTRGITNNRLLVEDNAMFRGNIKANQGHFGDGNGHSYSIDLKSTNSWGMINSDNGFRVKSVERPSLTNANLSLITGEGGNLDASATYYYSVTFLTAIGETTIQASSASIATTADDRKVRIALPISPDYRVIARKIYRSNGGGGQYLNYLLTTIYDNTTTTFDDDIPDDSLTGNTSYFRDNTTTNYMKDGTTTVFAPGINVFRAGNVVGRDDATGGRNALAGVNVLYLTNSIGMSDTSAFGYGIGYTGGYSSSVFMGSYCAGALSSTGNTQVTAMGYGTLFGSYSDSNRAISYSTAVGYGAGSAGSRYQALLGISAGGRNRGDANTYAGAYSGQGVTDGTGASNVGIGYYSMFGIGNGTLNTAVGRDSGRGVVDTHSGIFLGRSAGRYDGVQSGELFINSYDRTDRAGDLANSIIYGKQTSDGVGQELYFNADTFLMADNRKQWFGAGKDASIVYDGTNMIINPKEVGSGYLDILGNIQAVSVSSFSDTNVTTEGLKVGATSGTNPRLTFMPLGSLSAGMQLGSASGLMQFRNSAGTAIMAYTNSQVGIGTTEPREILTIANISKYQLDLSPNNTTDGNTAMIRFRNSSFAAYSAYIGTVRIAGGGGKADIVFGTNNGTITTDADVIERMRITYDGQIKISSDTSKLFFGAGDDASLYYNGTNMIINPKEVGSGILDILGNIQATNFQTIGTSTLFYGAKNPDATITSTNGIYIGTDLFGTGTKTISGSDNVVIGEGAVQFLTTGLDNTIIGQFAGSRLTTGGKNTNIGNESGGSTTGSNTVSVGYRAGLYTIGTASWNNASDSVYIGAQTESSTATTSNEIVIGANADGKGSNTVVLGADTIASTYLKGDVYLQEDNDDIFFGTDNDASIGYDGTNMIVNPKEVGSGYLDILGDVKVNNFISTGGNEFIAHDVIRHTITATDVSNGYFTESWNKATTKKIVKMSAVIVDEADANDTVYSDDWITANKTWDVCTKYDGTTVTGSTQGVAFVEGDIVTVYMVYEK